MSRKMTVDLSARCVEVLEECARKEGREPTEILRRALGVYATITEKGLGGKIQISYPTGDKKVYYVR